MNAFEGLLFNSSIGAAISDMGLDRTLNWVGFRRDIPFETLRAIVLFDFSALPEIAEHPAPTFTFVHIVTPHRPFLFGPNGESLEPSWPFTLLDSDGEADSPSEDAQYRDQAVYTTHRIEEAIASIMANSASPSIIILQSDHGAGHTPEWLGTTLEGIRERSAILNAYLLPPSCADGLYPEITPINSFPLVFNCVYGGDYPYLEDQVFFSYQPRGNDYAFRNITDVVK